MLTILILLPIFGCFVLLSINYFPIMSLGFFSRKKAAKPIGYLNQDLVNLISSSRSSLFNSLLKRVDYIINKGQEDRGYDLKLRKIALFISIITFMWSAILWIYFTGGVGETGSSSPLLYLSFQDLVGSLGGGNTSNYQFITYLPSIAGSLGGGAKIGVDSIGLVFIMLTTYLIPVAILATWDTIQHDIKSHLISLLAIEAILILVFVSLDLIYFYISFEAVLIPLYLLVGSHGATSARIKASMLLFLYTLGGSLFMLLGLISLINLQGSSDLTIISSGSLLIDDNIHLSRWIWFSIFLSLSIKAPLVPVHIWLKTVHAEAPLSGSIILAGLVLKLSVYGYLRILMPLLPEASRYFSPLVLTLGVITIIHGALVTLRQVDTKAFVAQSSVSHMGTVIVGLGAGNMHGLEGAILLSLAHGLVSPALFILVGGVLYDRYHSRTIRYFRGLGQHMPSFKLWFFLASCCNMGVPGSLNWISELLCLTGTFEVSPIAGILAATTVFLGAVYTMWLYIIITGGSLSPYLAITPDLSKREKAMLIYLIVPTIFLGFYPAFILDPLYLSLSSIIL